MIRALLCCILAIALVGFHAHTGHPRVALGTITFESSSDPLEMPAEWDDTQPVDILITSSGGLGENGPGGGAGGRGGGGGGFCRWNGVVITNAALCSIEITINEIGVGSAAFVNESGLRRNVLNGLPGTAGGIGGGEQSSDFVPSVSFTGGNGGAGLANGSGGGGGGAASESGNGGNGASANGGGAGGTGSGGDAGNGGNGGSLGNDGFAGENYGGGGGGSSVFGGQEAFALVKIIYTIRADAPLSSDMRGGFNDLRAGFID